MVQNKNETRNRKIETVRKGRAESEVQKVKGKACWERLVCH